MPTPGPKESPPGIYVAEVNARASSLDDWEGIASGAGGGC